MPSATLAASSQRAPQSTLLPVGSVCEVIDSRTGIAYPATILSRRWGSSSNPASSSNADSDAVQYYIHRHDQDKRMDGWVDHTSIRATSALSSVDAKLSSSLGDPSTPIKAANGSTAPHPVEKGKRKADDLEGSDGSRTPSVSRQQSPALLDRSANHRGGGRQKTSAASPTDTPALRNIDRVLYGNYDIKTWYHSPYPLDHDDEAQEGSGVLSAASGGLSSGKRNQSPLGLRAGTVSGANKRIARKDSGSSLGGALSTSSRDAPALRALASGSADTASSPTARHSPASPSTTTFRNKKDLLTPTPQLWICDGCFKYMKTYNGFSSHRKFCRYTHPPGRKVYQRGAHIIWEVDGAAQKLYCQNLSLFGKLFIDHKTIYFDVEPFTFYVLTDAATATFDHALGFFSKEKVSYDDYNLACIVTFPPFQRKSFGTLMIEFSYYLSGRGAMLGTPERPLSDLGLKGYLSFWLAVVCRALMVCWDGPMRVEARLRKGSPSKVADEAGESEVEEAVRKWYVLRQRCRLLGVELEDVSHQEGFEELQRMASGESSDAMVNSSHKRRLRLKGWAGSMPTRKQNGGAATADAESQARRSSRAAAEKPIHPALNISTLSEDCTMAVTVESLSRLTHLRPDDIVLALSEAGLVDAANTPFLATTDEAITATGDIDTNGKPQLALLLTRDAIREAITRFNIRPAVLDESYVLI